MRVCVFFSVNICCGIAAGKVMGRAIIIGKTVFFFAGFKFSSECEGRKEGGKRVEAFDTQSLPFLYERPYPTRLIPVRIESLVLTTRCILVASMRSTH